MTDADPQPDGGAVGTGRTIPADLVGGFVYGPVRERRQVVRAEPQFRAFYELELPDGYDPDREAFSTVFQYPPAEYIAHMQQHGSPKGYAGPAACCRGPWDIDRANDLDAALADCRKLSRFLRDRYGELAERGLSVWYSGAKGFHLTLPVVPGFVPHPYTPAVVKTFAVAVARQAGVNVDPGIYDRQRLFRLPNSRHPRTGLHKRLLDIDDLDRLSIAAIRGAARHPAGHSLPAAVDECEQLADDWEKAERAALSDNALSSNGRRVSPHGAPVVPDYVRRFIGFGDVQDPGRAVTLWRCAAALAEAGTPAPVVFGLLAEPAVKTGLDPSEVERQIRSGIERGTRGGKEVAA